MSFIVRKNGIYMIKSGRGVDRRIFVSGADYCFVIFKRKRGYLALWTYGITPDEGRSLVKAYMACPPTSSSGYGKLFNNLMRERVNVGDSECGRYGISEFRELLCDYFGSDMDDCYGAIYSALNDVAPGIEELK